MRRIAVLNKYFIMLIFILTFVIEGFSKGLDMILLLDRSGSMKGTDPNYMIIPTTAYIIEQLYFSGEENSRVSVITFSNDAQILGNVKNPLNNNFCEWLDLLQLYFNSKYPAPCLTGNRNKLAKLVKTQLEANGYTDLYPALRIASSLLSKDENKEKYIILLTDGMPFPDINENDTILKNIIGKDLFYKVLKKMRKEKKEFYQLYQEGDADALKVGHLYLEAILNFADKKLKGKIKFIPIVFDKTEREGIEFLKKLSSTINGEKNAIIYKVNKNNLLSTIANIVPRTERNLLIYKNEKFSGKTDIKVPKLSEKIRVFFYFPKNNTISKVFPKVEINDDLITPIESREFYDKKKKLIYKSLIIDQAGNIKISLYNANNKLINSAYLIIDTVADLNPILTVNPKVPVIGDKVELKFAIKTKTGENLPLSNVRFIITGKDRQNSDKILIKEAIIENNEAVAQIRLKQSGNYNIEVISDFSISNAINNIKKKFLYTLFIKPSLDLKGKVFFDYLDSKSSEKKDNIVANLPELGFNPSVEINNIGIKNTLNAKVKHLYIYKEEPIYNKCPEEYMQYCDLSLNGENWLTVQPSKNITINNQKIKPITIKAHIQSKVIPEIPDGLYTSYINLYYKGEILDRLQVNLPINIPKIVFDSADTGKRYIPWEKDFLKKDIVYTIHYPPPENDDDFKYKIEIPVWNSVNKKTRINVDFNDRNPYAIVLEDNKPAGFTDDIIFEIPSNEYLLPEKKENKATNVNVYIKLLNTKDLKKHYTKTILLTADNYRESYANILVNISIFPKTLLVLLYIILMLLVLALLIKSIYSFWGKYELRKRELKPNLMFNNLSGGPLEIRIKRFDIRKFKLRKIPALTFKIVQQGKNYYLKITNEIISNETTYSESDINPITNSISFDLGKHGRIKIGLYKESSSDPTVKIRIIDSPVSWKNFLLKSVLFLIIIGFLLYISIVNPYFPMQYIYHPLFN